MDIRFILLLIFNICASSCSINVGSSFDYHQLSVKAKVDFKPSKIKKKHISPFSETEVKQAIQLFYTEWLNSFGKRKSIELKNTLDELIVHFTEKEIPLKKGYFVSGKPFPLEGIKALGVTHSRKLIEVWIREPPYRLSKTSFAHELVHVALIVLNGEPDADHLGEKYSGWTKRHSDFIVRFNKKLDLGN